MTAVQLESIEMPWWSERAIAVGVDPTTGERLTFAMRKDRTEKVAAALEAGESPITIEVPTEDALFRQSTM